MASRRPDHSPLCEEDNRSPAEQVSPDIQSNVRNTSGRSDSRLSRSRPIPPLRYGLISGARQETQHVSFSCQGPHASNSMTNRSGSSRIENDPARPVPPGCPRIPAACTRNIAKESYAFDPRGKRDKYPPKRCTVTSWAPASSHTQAQISSGRELNRPDFRAHRFMCVQPRIGLCP
jgi:hypothetical protein